MSNKKSITIAILARQREMAIASTVLLLKDGTKNDFNADIVVVDNGSTDRTVKLASRAGARVISYPSRVEREKVIRKGLDVGKNCKSDLFMILDLIGDNTAMDGLDLLNTIREKGDEFTSAYVTPGKGEDTLGCWAVDRRYMGSISSGGNLEDALLEIVEKNNIHNERILVNIRDTSKRKKRTTAWCSSMGPVEMLYYLGSTHPLKFYGGLGMMILLFSLATGFYSIGFFYRETRLDYVSAFLTVTMVMVGGFFLTAGLMLNSLRVLLERLQAAVSWMNREAD